MFWDKAAKLYDLFENVYNGEVNRKLVAQVAGLVEENDRVLECACGTGMITKAMAPKCREVVATDYSKGMLREAQKNLRVYPNVKVAKANIMGIRCKDGAFDKVVAGNVIHLLDQPYEALNELLRCCKSGGKVIIPTYINNENAGKPNLFVQMLEKFGADFKKQFDFASYREFFDGAGLADVEYIVVEGKMPCAVAIITKK